MSSKRDPRTMTRTKQGYFYFSRQTDPIGGYWWKVFSKWGAPFGSVQTWNLYGKDEWMYLPPEPDGVKVYAISSMALGDLRAFIERLEATK